MNVGKLWDIFLCYWFSFGKVFALQSERSERIENAEITHTRLRAISNKRVEKVVVPIAVLTSLPISTVENSGLPELHEFRKVLGVDPVVPMTANREKPLSHISQYRLAAYVSGLTEGQKALVYEDLAGSVECA
jgi:hypothetical protein